MESFVTVAAFNEREPADLLAARMRQSGFSADVHDESQEQKLKFFNLTPRAHLQVRVPSGEEDRALATLAEWSSDPVLSAAVRCPECGSLRVEFPQFSRKTIVGALPAVLAAAGVIEKNYFCLACNHTWPPKAPAPEPKLDRLNWPEK